MSLAQNIRNRRSISMLTQEQVAQAIKVPREHIAMWETETRQPNPQQLEALAKLFRVSISHLQGVTPPIPTNEWHHIEDQLDESDPSESIQLWRQFLNSWAAFLSGRKAALRGRQKAPKELATMGIMSDARKASSLSLDVRKFYGLGLEPIRNMYAFLDEQGILVCKAPLGRLNTDGSKGISGVFYNHSKLGFCILVNSETIPARQSFTLAHEFAHALYHYSMFGLISRNGLDDPKEKFADTFAANFLVPSRKLRDLVEETRSNELNPASTLRLAYHFGISYKAMLFRLKNERLITATQCNDWAKKSPASMAPMCNIDPSYFLIPKSLPPLEFPGLVTDEVAWLASKGELSKEQTIEIFGSTIAALLEPIVTGNGITLESSINDDEDDWLL
jgi:Zn-dependent peptidase ImmA (M78 family)